MDVPREKLFRAWTEPELMKQWFAPLPWTTPHVEVDPRAGGTSVHRDAQPEGTGLSEQRRRIWRW